jgi:hypothetical protein
LDHLRFSYEGENFLHVFGLKGSVLRAFEAEIQRQVFELQNHEMLDFIESLSLLQYLLTLSSMP